MKAVKTEMLFRYSDDPHRLPILKQYGARPRNEFQMRRNNSIISDHDLASLDKGSTVVMSLVSLIHLYDLRTPPEFGPACKNFIQYLCVLGTRRLDHATGYMAVVERTSLGAEPGAIHDDGGDKDGFTWVPGWEATVRCTFYSARRVLGADGRVQIIHCNYDY